MSTTRFTRDHEWIRVDGDLATVGITDYAQRALGDLVFVELPTVGARLAQGADAGVVESVKAASAVLAPADGEVVALNPAVEADAALVNRDAEGEGWFFRLRLSDPAQLDALLDEAAYRALVAGLA